MNPGIAPVVKPMPRPQMATVTNASHRAECSKAKNDAANEMCIRDRFQPLVFDGDPFGVLGNHCGDIEVCFAAEVAGDESGVNPGLLTDLPYRRTLEPLLPEEGLGRPEQGVPTGCGVPGPAGPASA